MLYRLRCMAPHCPGACATLGCGEEMIKAPPWEAQALRPLRGRQPLAVAPGAVVYLLDQAQPPPGVRAPQVQHGALVEGLGNARQVHRALEERAADLLGGWRQRGWRQALRVGPPGLAALLAARGGRRHELLSVDR